MTQGCGSALMTKANKLEQMCRSMIGVMGDVPLTVKIRTGVSDHKAIAHNLIPRLRDAGVSLVTVSIKPQNKSNVKLSGCSV